LVRILDDYRRMIAANRRADPVRPVMFSRCVGRARPTQFTLHRRSRVKAQCTDLFNVSYEILVNPGAVLRGTRRRPTNQLGTLANRVNHG